MNPAKLAFIHVPKSAGTYVDLYFRKILPPEGFQIHSRITPPGDPSTPPRLINEWREEELLQIADSPGGRHYVKNHSYNWTEKACLRFKKAGWTTFAFLRHPGDGLCSYYFFFRERHGQQMEHTLNQFITMRLDETDRFWEIPEFWPLLDFVAPFSDGIFDKFLRSTLGVAHTPSPRANTTQNLGYSYYCQTGEISEENRRRIEETRSSRVYNEVKSRFEGENVL